MTLISPAYTTEAAMERLLSIAGVTAFADMDATGTRTSGVVDDCVNQATQEIDLYCRQRYSQAGLLASTIINRWATVYACVFLCERRGNSVPDSLMAEFNRIADKLEKIAASKLQLPGVALATDTRPTVSNLRIDRRYQNSKVRVERPISTNTPSTQRQNFSEDIPSVLQ